MQPKKGRNKKSRARFTPTPEQIQTARRRIEGIVDKSGGLYHTSNNGLLKELAGRIYNRGDELGSNSEELTLTIKTALAGFEETVRYEERADGVALVRVGPKKPDGRKAQVAHRRKNVGRQYMPRFA